MSNDAEYPVNRQMQQEINDDRDNQRDYQRVTSISAGAANNSAKRSIERIGDRDYESDKARTAASGE